MPTEPLKADLVDACENLRMGTKMFAKILRIITKWYGDPTSEEVFPQLFEDAVYAWKTGEFEGERVFQAEDPASELVVDQPQRSDMAVEPDEQADADSDTHSANSETAAENAEMRVDLSRVVGP